MSQLCFQKTKNINSVELVPLINDSSDNYFTRNSVGYHDNLKYYSLPGCVTVLLQRQPSHVGYLIFLAVL